MGIYEILHLYNNLSVQKIKVFIYFWRWWQPVIHISKCGKHFLCKVASYVTHYEKINHCKKTFSVDNYNDNILILNKGIAKQSTLVSYGLFQRKKSNLKFCFEASVHAFMK